MKSAVPIFLSLFTAVLVAMCGSDDPPPSHYYDKAHKHIESRGELVENKPHGFWEFYDTLGNLTESGDFIMGWRTGSWNYYSPKFDTMISWDTLICGGYQLNIPGADKKCTLSNATELQCSSAISEININNLGIIELNDSTAIDILAPSDSMFNRYDIWNVKTTSGEYSIYHLRGWTVENTWVHHVLFNKRQGSYIIKMSFPFALERLNVYNIIFTNVLTTAMKDGRVLFDNSTTVADNELLKRVIIK